MPLALHRSITFWFGLLTLAFLAWAWWDSVENYSTANSDRYELRHSFSGIAMERISAGHHSMSARGFSRQPQPAVLRKLTMPPFVFVRATDETVKEAKEVQRRFFEEQRRTRVRGTLTLEEGLKWRMASVPPRDWILYIPHWLMISIFTGLWLALLLWRGWRRKKKGMTHAELPNSE